MAKGNRKKRDPTETTAKMKAAAGTAVRTAVRLAVAVLLVVTTFSAVVGVYLWATTTPRFAVTDVRFRGNVRARLDELAALSGLKAGTNLFLVDEAAVAREIERHPWVRRAVVRSRLPHTLFVDVEEYEPVALAALDGLYVISSEGEPIKRLSSGETFDFPVITGAKEGAGEAGADLTARLREGLSFIRAWKKAALDDRMVLSEVNVDELAGLTATARPKDGGPPVVVHLGRGDLSRRLARLEQLHEILQERSQRPLEIFLNNHTRPQWVVARVEP